MTAGYKPQDRITEGHKTNGGHNSTEEKEDGNRKRMHGESTGTRDEQGSEIRTGPNVVRSCCHCSSGKAISIAYCVCVFVALGIQYALRMHLWPAPLYNI